MVRPLTKCGKDGMRYTRPQAVESEIESALRDDLPALKRRLSITDRGSSGYLRSECLVHLIRDARRRNDDQSLNAVLPILLVRCEAILRAKVSDQLPNADLLREDVLSEFSELLASDGTDKHSDDLDYYECRFNRAFRMLRVDAVRQETNQAERTAELIDHTEEDKSEISEEIFARRSQLLQTPETQEDSVFLEKVLETIDALPPDERKAVILCRVYEYKEESDDPNEVTAATLCNCTGRTIRNRLSRAATKLSQLKEES